MEAWDGEWRDDGEWSDDDDTWPDGEEPHVAARTGPEISESIHTAITQALARNVPLNNAARLALAVGYMGEQQPGRVVEFTLDDLKPYGIIPHGVTSKMLVDQGAVDAVVQANLMQPTQKKNWRKKMVPRPRSEWHKCKFRYTGNSQTFFNVYNGLQSSWTPAKKKKGWFRARASTM